MNKYYLLMFLLVSSIFAQPISFIFQNDTPDAIDELFLAIEGNEWSENLLYEVILSGESIEITFDDGSQECNYNFLLISQEGNSYLIDEMDLCQPNMIVLNNSHFVGNYQKPEYADDYQETEIDGAIEDVITYNTWKILVCGEDYGTIKLNCDHTCLKTGSGGIFPTNGTWSLDDSGSLLTLHFPKEGPSFEGNLFYYGNKMDIHFYDGAIIWNLEGM